jgi:hypothetical protein
MNLLLILHATIIIKSWIATEGLLNIAYILWSERFCHITDIIFILTVVYGELTVVYGEHWSESIFSAANEVNKASECKAVNSLLLSESSQAAVLFCLPHTYTGLGAESMLSGLWLMNIRHWTICCNITTYL